MSGTLKVGGKTLVTHDTSSNQLAFHSDANETGQLCRAWVNFDGTGTVAIRASFNVASITDNGTGDYTVNFTTAMPDDDYVVTACGRHHNGVSQNGIIVAVQSSDGDNNVDPGSVRISIHMSDSALRDSPLVGVAIFR